MYTDTSKFLFSGELFQFHPKVFKDHQSPSQSPWVGGRDVRKRYFGLQATLIYSVILHPR